MSEWDRRAAAQQQRVREVAVQQWLPRVVASSAYWRARASSFGLEAVDATNVEQLQRFAPTRENDLLAAAGPGGADLVQRPNEEQVKAYGDTSTIRRVVDGLRRGGQAGRGRALLESYKPIHLHTAGVRGGLTIASSRSDLDLLHRCGARAAEVLGLRTDDYLLDALPYAPSLQWWGVRHLALGASILALHPRSEGEGLEALRAALPLVPVTAVVVVPEEAVALADLMGGVAGGVRRVVLAGPPPPDEVRGEIAAAWRRAGADAELQVLALWAPPAARALWAESDDGVPGLVTYPDLDLVEVVDPATGRPTDGAGDLTITSLGWNGTALVRFQTGVLVEGVRTDVVGRTVTRVLGPQPEVWQPRLTRAGAPVPVDLRGVAAVLGAATDVTAWRVEVPEHGAAGEDHLLVELSGPELSAPRLRELDAALAVAVGAAPTQLAVFPDASEVTDRAARLGSVFADLRA